MATVPVSPPLCNYTTCNDSSPGAQVWDLAAGRFVPVSDATFNSWLSQLANAPVGQPYWPFYLQIFSAASSDAGTTTTLQVDNTSIMTTGAKYNISATGLYDGNQVVTVVDGTHVKISVAFAGNATGNLSGATIIATAALLNNLLRGAGLTLIPTSGGFYQSSSILISANTTLANPMAISTVVTVTAGGPTVKLPPMNAANSLPIGVPCAITNDAASTNNFLLTLNDNTAFPGLNSGGSTGQLPPGATMWFVLLANDTAAGTVKVLGVFPSNVVASIALGGTGTGLSLAGLLKGGNPISSISGTNGQKVSSAPAWVNPGNGGGDGNLTLSPGTITGEWINFTNATLTAPRTWTLPPANGFAPGTKIGIVDAAGGVTSTNTLSVARAGSDTINGSSSSVVLNRAFDWVTLETDGVSKWTIVGGKGAMASTDLPDLPIPVASGGTGDTGTGWTPYTPTIAPGSGSFTSASATGRYKSTGKTVLIEINVSITTNGTAGGWIEASLPPGIAPAVDVAYTLAGIDLTPHAVCAFLRTINGSVGGPHARFFKYDGTYPGATGSGVLASGVFEST